MIRKGPTKKPGKKFVQKAQEPHRKAPKMYSVAFQTDSSNISSSSKQLDNICDVCHFGMCVRHQNLNGKLVQHNCKGNVCLKCIQSALEKQNESKTGIFSCPLCEQRFEQHDIREMHPDLLDKIQDQLTMSLLADQFVQCRFCPNKFLFQKEESSSVPKEFDGRILTDDQISCTAENYICCHECHISTCKECKAVPYHFGETCQEHQWFVEGYVCRICGRAAKPPANSKIALITCDSEKCKEVANKMCKEVLPCGHACVGCACDGAHPLCPLCTVGGSLCPCCKKPLWGSLCLRLSCGHTLHRNCALSILEKSTDGPCLDLPICPAPGCGSFVWHPSISDNQNVPKWGKIMRYVEDLISARIFAEGIMFHPDVASKLNAFAWAGDEAPRNWAKKKLRFMICHKHDPPCVYTDGRLDDPLGDLSCSCPKCPDYRFPVCDQCGFKWMQNKCQCCCSVGVRHASSIDERKLNGNSYWYCEICREMPRKSQTSSCKGNCKFAPHPNLSGNFYAYCPRCEKVFTKPRGFLKKSHQ